MPEPADPTFAHQTATQHDGTDQLAIINTRYRRLLSLIAIQTVARFYQYDGVCRPLSSHIIVKTGPFVHLTEAATMKAFIVMERIRGQSLAKAVRPMSEADRRCVFAQLRRIIQELRALSPPPGTGVESCRGGSLRDFRIPRSRPRFGPFRTIQNFHWWLRGDFEPEDLVGHDDDEVWNELMTWRDMKEMMVIGIIDWEFSGWYPNYWEYTSAYLGNSARETWRSIVNEFLDPYPEDLRVPVSGRPDQVKQPKPQEKSTQQPAVPPEATDEARSSR